MTGISANHGTQYSENDSVITVSSIVRPATVNVSTRLKQQNVIFGANGGEGAMASVLMRSLRRAWPQTIMILPL